MEVHLEGIGGLNVDLSLRENAGVFQSVLHGFSLGEFNGFLGKTWVCISDVDLVVRSADSVLLSPVCAADVCENAARSASFCILHGSRFLNSRA